MAQGIDPIKFEVIRNALTMATEEMATTLRRSAYSTNVKTRQDFSCAFFDKHLRLVAQAFSQPVHLGSFVKLIPTSITRYGPDNIGPGDMIVVNDPYGGGTHLNDVTVFAPVHHSDDLVGYVCALAHHVDVGGGAPASIGPFQEIFQEGVIIPPVKLVKSGEIVEDVFNLVLAQIRSKRVTSGDFRAQIAANKAGYRRIVALIDKYGISDFNIYVDALISYTSRRTESEIKKLPLGTFQSESFLDFDGFTDKVVKLRVSVEVGKDGVLFDFDGCDAQRRAPVNSTYAMTFSACAYVLKALLDKDLPINHGFYKFVQINAPPGTVVNAVYPAAVVGGWETQIRINDTLFRALSSAMPEVIPAGCKAMMAQVGFGLVDAETGEYHCNYEALAGGYGARATKDGPDAVQGHGQNTENAPVEEIESHFPVRITRLELIENSEGAGRYRGGLGLRRDYHFPDDPATFTILSDRDIEGPHGLFGGRTGRKAYYILNPDGESRPLMSKSITQLNPGDTVSFQTPGGGGYGPPEYRDPDLVVEDVVAGKISVERAREIYLVAVDVVEGQMDKMETSRLRKDRSIN